MSLGAELVVDTCFRELGGEVEEVLAWPAVEVDVEEDLLIGPGDVHHSFRWDGPEAEQLGGNERDKMGQECSYISEGIVGGAVDADLVGVC